MPAIVKKPDFEIKEAESPTFADIYRQWLLQRLKLASAFANAVYDKLFMLNVEDGQDKEQKLEELKELTNIYLTLVGYNERWFYDFSKHVLNNEMGLYGGLLANLMPNYIGDIVANLERYNILKSNKESNLGAVLATVLSLLGVRVSPDLVQQVVDILKKQLNLGSGTSPSNT
jgi:hypothetical protein